MNSTSSSDASGKDGESVSSSGGTAVRGADGKDGESVTSVNGTVVRGADGADGQGAVGPSEVRTEQISGPVARIVLSAEAGRITMVGTDGGEVSVTRSIYRQTGEPRETVSHDGDVLRIDTRCPTGGSNTCRIDYEIQVPRSTPVELTTATGNVDVAGARGAVTAKSVSGGIQLRDHGAPTTVAASTTGSVQVQAVTRPDLIEISSTSGSIAVAVPGGAPYRLETATMTGRKTVNVAADAGAASVIRTKTITGNVQVVTG